MICFSSFVVLIIEMELETFKITVLPLRQKMLNFSQRLVEDTAEAEDVVQEAFIKLWYIREKLDAEKVEEKKTFTLRSVLYLVSGIAASFLLLLGLNHLLNPVDPCFCSDNYVVINGRCYTDIHKVRSMALEALQEVATPADEYFPEVDRDEADRMIIDNQLDELRSLFDDNE